MDNINTRLEAVQEELLIEENRIKDLSADLHRIRSESYFKKIDFVIYKVETKIMESELYTNGEIYFN